MPAAVQCSVSLACKPGSAELCTATSALAALNSFLQLLPACRLRELAASESSGCCASTEYCYITNAMPCWPIPSNPLTVLSSLAAGCLQDPNVSSAWHVPSAILAQVQRLLKPGEDEIAQVSQVDSWSWCQLLSAQEPGCFCVNHLLLHRQC